jgi:ankyrin repeat protein
MKKYLNRSAIGAVLTVCLTFLFGLERPSFGVQDLFQDLIEAVADQEQAEVIASLLNRGTQVGVNLDVNLKDEDGLTPLHLAAISGQTEVVKLLLDHGAQIEVIDDQTGGTPLHFAAQRGHAHTAAALLRGGAPIEVADLNGQTALHLAVQKFQRETLVLLLKESTSVNAQDQGGDTPLHLIAGDIAQSEDDLIEMAKMLIAAGADVHLKNLEGDTVLDLARKNERLRLFKLIENPTRLDLSFLD